ncbi:hypothetical protein R50073_47890 [Maricurvus nonylphenolicus]|uniref:TIGR02444 family protein n=1 Tax=Maricurvus nonylphenolicus TaxID=1008307 RepID=UPI0036F26971
MFTSSFDHPFGDYALALYSRSEVAQCCLQWQDELGVDVNLLLWASWLDSQGIVFQESVWLAGCARVKRLREWGIKPLRSIRRAVKPYDKLYGLMKRIELWAESIAMRRLYRLAQSNSLTVLQQGDQLDTGYCVYYLESLNAGDRLSVWKQWVELKGRMR